MGLLKVKILFSFLVFFCAYSPLFGTFSLQEGGKMRYYMHKCESTKAFTLYLEEHQREGEHDFELLKELGMMLLTQGACNPETEVQLLSLFGASITADPSLLPVFEQAAKGLDLHLQLAAIAGLRQLQDDQADLILLQILSSPFLLARLEAALILAQKNNPTLLGHLQSLFAKIPPPIRPLLPQIIIKLKGEQATKMLKQMLYDLDVDVRIETIRFAAKEGRDDLLPLIQSIATSPNYAQQEACFFALGTLKDGSARPPLESAADTKQSELKLAALRSLFILGDQNAIEPIIEEAQKGNLFAIALLGKLGNRVDEQKEQAITLCLQTLAATKDLSVRFNSGVSLLRLKKRSAIPILKEFLLPSKKDLGITSFRSCGRTLVAFRIIPSKRLMTKKYPSILPQTQKIKEDILIEALELPEEDFLDLTEQIFASSDLSLIPGLIELLCHHKTDNVITFLKRMEQKAGRPLVRHYSLLALYRLGEEGNYEEKVLEIVEKEQHTALISFKDREVPKGINRLTHYLLTPEESSKLLISAFELFIQKQSTKGTIALLKAMIEGHPKNKYALAGILIKGVE